MNQLESLQKIDRSQNIDGWRVQLYFFSRNPKTLAMIALFVTLIAVGVGWAVQKPILAQLGIDPFEATELKAELDKPQPDMGTIIAMLPRAAGSFFEDVPLPEWIAASQLSAADKLVTNALWTSLQEGDGFEPSADLLYYAHYVKPLRYTNELIGDHYLATEEYAKAAPYFRREAKFPDARKAREKLLAVSIELHDRPAIQELSKDPTFAAEFKPEHRLYFAAQERRWSEMVAPLRDLQASLLQPVPLALATLAGLVWFLVALQAVQPPGFFSFRMFLPPFAVVAGMVSTFPTLLSGLWMEGVFGLRHTGNVFDDFLFFMLSVGPREEIIKLAFFVPFLPLLLFRKDRLEALMLAGCVGLGFAVWENLQYFAQFGSAVAFPRFLTANFFHLALTGLNGLALFDLLRHPIRGFLPFVGIFLGTTLAHGAYDVMGSIQGVPVLVFGSMIIFMLVSLFFFRTLQKLRNATTDQLSIAGTFVVGISLLAGVIIVFAAREIGLIPTLATFAITGFGMIMVGYMFYWQLGEGMSAAGESPARPYAT